MNLHFKRNRSDGTAAEKRPKRSLLARSALLLAILMLVAVTGKGQFSFGEKPSDEPKANYKYVLVYRVWQQSWQQRGDAMSPVNKWVTEIEGFNSLEDLMAWLNIKDFLGRPMVRLSDNELIAIYDLSKAKKVQLDLKTENKSLPKRVEVQEEKWTEQHYELGNGN